MDERGPGVLQLLPYAKLIRPVGLTEDVSRFKGRRSFGFSLLETFDLEFFMMEHHDAHRFLVRNAFPPVITEGASYPAKNADSQGIDPSRNHLLFYGFSEPKPAGLPLREAVARVVISVVDPKSELQWEIDYLK